MDGAQNLVEDQFRFGGGPKPQMELWSTTSKNREKKLFTAEELNLSWKLGEDKKKGLHGLNSCMNSFRELGEDQKKKVLNQQGHKMIISGIAIEGGGFPSLATPMNQSVLWSEMESRAQGSRPWSRTQKNSRPRTDRLKAKDRNVRGKAKD